MQRLLRTSFTKDKTTPLLNVIVRCNNRSLMRNSTVLYTSSKLFSSSIRNYNKKVLERITINKDSTKQHQKVEPISKTNGFNLKFSTWKASVIFLAVGASLYLYLRREKRLLEIQKEAEANRGYGTPFIGGPFKLTDFNGNPFTDQDLLGKFTIIYFGFSHCPDICPEELDKLGVWLDDLKKRRGSEHVKIQPIFITCDPNRDTPEVLKAYLKDFHPDIVGVTGTYDEIKDMCAKYKAFFATPRETKNQDYIVEHSIFFYLMDPEGQFIDALGGTYDEKSGVDKIEQHIKAYIPKEEREKLNNKWYSFLFK
ncbi:putative thioredoxin peroxidase SCO2 NDAI_0A07220 [Naumovozyma dairenensis CBS 421]|uniref:Thioredoxin domain-containing protein n=1 Tax=Naumovozyma dairenensis (strain ATCC 10597 / BCRC 20456 / CBS 421 / NBRC 0211 / NRRL Y-12639) TaxID=1071378 RepID=G0W4Y8_NAUDC|nr:hypothetical protein NDAI_0A07220 [Naumovozyma dairenensis CBS 421]CCD22876.1 hypothetical protein NDAI_0A07220 [Naumovozyma dairenensis CBS 421]